MFESMPFGQGHGFGIQDVSHCCVFWLPFPSWIEEERELNGWIDGKLVE